MLQHREKRMEQEKELLEKKIEWSTAELKNKTDELLNTNRDKGKEILELQSSLKNTKEQVTHNNNTHPVWKFTNWAAAALTHLWSYWPAYTATAIGGRVGCPLGCRSPIHLPFHTWVLSVVIKTRKAVLLSNVNTDLPLTFHISERSSIEPSVA